MELLILITFIVGYLFIVMEHTIRLNKASTALIMGVVCWVVYAVYSTDTHLLNHQLAEHIGDISGILFFLIGAMTIVELIDLHDGFQIIIDLIQTKNKRYFLILITFISFFMSAILDNLTTAIVMCTLITKVLSEPKDKFITIGMIIIAANSGGAWSPIGDVTTTMLWIGNQITASSIVKFVFLPSLVSVLIPLCILIFRLKGNFELEHKLNSTVNVKERNTIFYTGLFLLILVPVFKMLTHLPPYMGMMFSVGIVWLVSETLHKKDTNKKYAQPTIYKALEKIDLPSILFFMGILLAVSALQSVGLLQELAQRLSSAVNNDVIIVTSIGLLSALFDNVPLVAAVQGMYPLSQYPTGHFFWEFLAYCAGTGGSVLIIGSAAGVAAMGIEKISFFWYVKNISLAALLGYLGGALVAVALQ